MCRAWVGAVMAMILLAPRARGQTGTIVGVVTDSMTGRPLAGASVRVDDAPTGATTDSSGHYRINAVPAGSHRLIVRHPALDSLALAVRSVAFDVPPNSTVSVSLATPSVATVFRLFCPDVVPAALIFGRVARVDSDDPVSGATVTAAWVESHPVGRAAKADSSGRYHVCVAPDHAIMLRARLESDAMSYVASAATDAVVFADVRLPAPGEQADAMLSGQVVNEAGAAVSGASVTLMETPGGNATTGADGRFHLQNLPAGTRVLIVRTVGLDASIRSVDLSARTPRTVNVSMRRPPPTLATVNVTAERAQLDEAYRRLGFTERQRIGIGRFITEDQIRNKGALTTGDVLTQVQGIKVGDNGDHGVDDDAIDGRASRFDPTTNACTLYVLDGEFVGQDDCAMVFVWTRAMLSQK